MDNDTIYRQAAINVLEERLQANGYSNIALVSELNRSIGYLMRLPAAEPEIIRCKDCKHRDVEKGFCEGRGWPMQLVPGDGFCDKGERRTDE